MPKLDWFKIVAWALVLAFCGIVWTLTFIGAAYLLGLLP